MHTTHSDFAEHHLKIKQLIRLYYRVRLKQDLDSAYAISLKILDEAMLLKQVTGQDMRITMVSQKS